jgi:hypothetical protein
MRGCGDGILHSIRQGFPFLGTEPPPILGMRIALSPRMLRIIEDLAGARYALTLHPDKTRFVDFRGHRPDGKDADGTTFTFIDGPEHRRAPKSTKPTALRGGSIDVTPRLRNL